MIVERVSLIQYLSDQMCETIKLHERLIRSHMQTNAREGCEGMRRDADDDDDDDDDEPLMPEKAAKGCEGTRSE